MFDHVTIRAADRPASERFYRTVLDVIGLAPTGDGREGIEWEDFSLAAVDGGGPATRHLHLAFVAESREQVDRFWRAGVEAGYPEDGPPGERSQYRPGYYGAFLLDPDGNSAEAVHHDDTRRGGHIDHLWIRVRDLDAANAFYAALARHAGLHQGRRWDVGVQFRGAWATFSLVRDGAPATEGLQIAFPAPDRQTVESFHREATAAGYRTGAAPAERQDGRGGCYAACVLDPDGTHVESVFRERPWPAASARKPSGRLSN